MLGDSVQETGASGATMSRILTRQGRPVMTSPQPAPRAAILSVMIVGVRAPYSSIDAGSYQVERRTEWLAGRWTETTPTYRPLKRPETDVVIAPRTLLPGPAGAPD